jgi:hypothetical protein
MRSWLASPQKKRYKTIQMNPQGCETCNDIDQRGSVFEQIGEPEHRTYLDGRAVETETHFRCKSCGSEWVNYIVDGLGGYDSFWIPL